MPKPIETLAELDALVRFDGDYIELAKKAARNLGGNPKDGAEAMRWLYLNAAETEGEEEGGGEEGVVAEVNFMID